ncbi:MAG: ATP-binding cassette domain-containing protein [Desulfarculus sp.]|nr:ATP-binding cassette domain-containing protein [Desulfarculus sp.]
MSAPLYNLRGLLHRYGDLPALDIPHLDIAAGAVIGLCGPNGSGKSTLLRILAFLEEPSQGEVLFDGQPRAPHTPGARQGITMLLQDTYLLKRGVAANLAYGLKLRGREQARPKALEEALAWVGLEPKTFARRRWYELSGGEAKRVALAARLLLRPRVLLLDEPTAGVDAKSAELLRLAALAARDQWGSTLVVASHDLEWLGRTVDQVWRLAYGRLQTAPPVPAGAPREIPIQALHLRLPADLKHGQRTVAGRVLALALDQEAGQGRVEVRAGEQTLSARLPLEALRRLNLQPGQDIWLALEDGPA